MWHVLPGCRCRCRSRHLRNFRLSSAVKLNVEALVSTTTSVPHDEMCSSSTVTVCITPTSVLLSIIFIIIISTERKLLSQPEAQLLYNLIICDYLKLLGKYFWINLVLLCTNCLYYSTISAASVITAVAVST